MSYHADDFNNLLANRIVARFDKIQVVIEPGFFPTKNTPSMLHPGPFWGPFDKVVWILWMDYAA